MIYLHARETQGSCCANPNRCKYCKKPHHTLLHQNHKEQMLKAPEFGKNSTRSNEASLSPTGG
jgi:hypothetical protein